MGIHRHIYIYIRTAVARCFLARVVVSFIKESWEFFFLPLGRLLELKRAHTGKRKMCKKRSLRKKIILRAAAAAATERLTYNRYIPIGTTRRRHCIILLLLLLYSCIFYIGVYNLFFIFYYDYYYYYYYYSYWCLLVFGRPTARRVPMVCLTTETTEKRVRVRIPVTHGFRLRRRESITLPAMNIYLRRDVVVLFLNPPRDHQRRFNSMIILYIYRNKLPDMNPEENS